MLIHQINLSNQVIKNNVFLAPMAGYTDYAFRKGIIDFGVGLTFTELVSAKGLIYGGEGSRELLYSGNDIERTAVQLFGEDAFFLRSACESVDLAKFKIVDINMGCPVPKVFRNGEGSALLTDIKKAENIIKECVKSGKIITIKIRTGIKKGDDIASDFAMMAEDAGASLISIHGRVREDYYLGEPDYKAIEKAKTKVKIPVIANGGIFTIEDADAMIDRTGADGVMLARGAVADPFLVPKLLGNKITITLKQFILNHLDAYKEIYEDNKTAREFRKFVPYYLKGIRGIKEVKLQLLGATSTSQIKKIIDENL